MKIEGWKRGMDEGKGSERNRKARHLEEWKANEDV